MTVREKWLVILSAAIFTCSLSSIVRSDPAQPPGKCGVLDDCKLSDTSLFSSVAQDCAEVPLGHWNHPTRLVLEKYQIPLSKLLLCNNKRYPIYFVDFKYDPHTNQSDRYFHPIYYDLLKANGGWPLAFVSPEWETVIMLRPSTAGSGVQEEVEFYKDAQ